MLTRYQDRAAGSHGFGTPGRTRLRSNRTGLQDLTRSDQQFQHAFKVSGRRCRISRVRNTKLNMLTRYQVGLQDLTGSEHQIVHAYEVSGRGCRISRVWNNSPTCIRGTCIRTGLQDLTGKEHQIELVRSGLQDLTGWEQQIVHAYEVLGRGCRISRVRNTRSYMSTRYQDGAAGSHGFETTNPTYLEGIRTRLQDLTSSEHHIVHA